MGLDWKYYAARVASKLRKVSDELRAYEELHEHIKNMRAIRSQFSVENKLESLASITSLMIAEMMRLEDEVYVPNVDMGEDEVNKRLEQLKSRIPRPLPEPKKEEESYRSGVYL